MLVRFWGTRGSLPVAPTSDIIRDKVAKAVLAVSGRAFATIDDARAFVAGDLDFATAGTYGGATTCVEIEAGDDAFIVCDMGSGLRSFGIDALRRCAAGHPRTYHFFLSHLHWDHIMGFPFFNPAFDPQATIVIHAGHADAEEALRRQQQEISFPVAFDWLRARISFVTLSTDQVHQIGNVSVELIEQQHSHVSYGYRFTDAAGKVVVFSTDSEHKLEKMGDEAEVAHFFRDADLVIADTMYSLADSISMKEDWGHSSNIIAIDLCHAGSAKRMALFHHEPTYSDEDILRMHHESIRYEELTRTGQVNEGQPLEIFCAYDGQEIVL